MWGILEEDSFSCRRPEARVFRRSVGKELKGVVFTNASP